MFRLGAVLIFAGMVAFGLGGFVLSHASQIGALIVGGLMLVGGIVVELTGGPMLETTAADTGAEVLSLPSPEVALRQDMLGPDVFPRGG
jgi:hypothetical protein